MMAHTPINFDIYGVKTYKQCIIFKYFVLQKSMKKRRRNKRKKYSGGLMLSRLSRPECATLPYTQKKQSFTLPDNNL